MDTAVTTIGTTIRNTHVTLYRYHDRAVDRHVWAVYHQDYRHVWMRQWPSNHYVHPRKSGNMIEDGTCYYPPHHNWSEDRNHWPAVLFQYKPDISIRGRNKPRNLITQEGWLVIDLNAKPVRDFHSIPFALSSKAEPFLLEAIMRENYDSDILVQDLRARMPGALVSGVDTIRTGTLSMAMSRFRRQAACISWSAKVGSDNIKEYLDALLPPNCLRANSTVGFRNLYLHEFHEVELMNAGLFPNKAKPYNKDFSDENKEKQFEKVAEKYRNKRKQFDGSSDFTATYYKVMANREANEAASNAQTTDDGFQDDVSMTDESEEDGSVLQDSGFHEPESSSLIDFRNLLPVTARQVELIQAMLEPARIQFRSLIYIEPPQTDTNADYLTQYNRLQSAITKEISDMGMDFPGLQLIGLSVFTDSKWDWNGRWFDEIFGPEPDRHWVSGMVHMIKDDMGMQPMTGDDVKLEEGEEAEPGLTANIWDEFMLLNQD